MRSSILCLLTIGIFGVSAMAQRPEQVDQALKQRYGEDVQVEIVGTPTEINGVRVFNVEIRDKRGESTAIVTEHGDFVRSGMPGKLDALPQNVQKVASLFADQPRQAQSFLADFYEVDLQQERDQVYRVRFDAVGRLRDVTSPQDVERFETTRFEKADETTAGKVQELAERHIPQGTQVRDVYVDPRHAGFYVVKYQSPQGREILVILDEQGNIYQTRNEIQTQDLPEHVRQAITRMFDMDRARFAYRTQQQFYEFDQHAPEGERMTFRVRPTGQIMQVQSPQADRDDEAVTARFREGARREGREGDPQPEPRRGRDR